MSILYAICVFVFWDPASNATHYDLYRDMIYSQTVTEPTEEICREAYYTPVTIHVVGLNETEGVESQPSDPLIVEWRWDFDCNDDEIVSFTDFGFFIDAFGKPNGGICDMNADQKGNVGYADFGLFLQAWGTCNDGFKEVECDS